MVLPPPSTSRLTALRNARNSRPKPQTHQQQSGITDFLKQNNPLPMSVRRTPHIPPVTKQRAPPLSESQSSTPIQSDKILNGVVACLDVRTEDGDDVSQNFERALQSMGAKTRRTFSDSVTHLVFKNGSPATLRRAISKNVFIINLLWISNCKREGKKVAEHKYMIDQTQGLSVTTGKKRRKSMEPGKVRALAMNELMQPTTSSSSEGSGNEDGDSSRRKTIATCSWKARDFNSRDRTRGLGKTSRPDFEDEDPLDGLAAEIKLNAPRLSLPVSVESIANKHNNSANKQNSTPIHAPSTEKKEQIKARFSIGSAVTRESPPIKIGTTPITTCFTGASPLKRRRKLTGNLSRTTTTSSDDMNVARPSMSKTTSASTEDMSITNQPKTIVLTSLSASVRKQCEDAIKRLGQYELATEVTENTTHVIVGVKRRTKTATFGLLRGAWMLKPEWLIQSELKNEYQPEPEYELIDWYPLNAPDRKRIPLLPSTTHIYVASSSTGLDLIKQMVSLSGASLVESVSEANVVISDTPLKETDKIAVNDTWLLDSIEQWQYVPTDAYAHKK
ncbi:hypothetical protein INT47_005689 [Mucor saturninus]|uniref:BRCT domain-containing protein n=1 Tax=Mucor saturninus TaxID=64648 RepID=A0A8H7QI98_9FUNG|nr:hypothetical protein INT47_005689 [Mucor saturninus]